LIHHGILIYKSAPDTLSIHILVRLARISAVCTLFFALSRDNDIGMRNLAFLTTDATLFRALARDGNIIVPYALHFAASSAFTADPIVLLIADRATAPALAADPIVLLRLTYATALAFTFA
jgi:hypothetical protein